jgi:hypothetical protein
MNQGVARIFCHLFFAILAASGFAAEPLPIADFNGEPLTSQGGEIAARQRIPSAVKWRLDDEEFHGDSGKSLRIEFIRLRGGDECHLALRIPGADLAELSTLTFWIKGGEGGEIFDVGLSDPELDRRDKLPEAMAPIEKSLPGCVTTEWQKAFIPRHQLLKTGGPRQPGSVIIAFNRITKYSVIHIDDIRFESGDMAKPKDAEIRH